MAHDHYCIVDLFCAIANRGSDSNRAASIMSRCYDTKIPFGKYQGYEFCDVSLRYLDQTISIMPPTWIVREAQDFVWACMFAMNHICNSQVEENGQTSIVPSSSINDIIESGIFNILWEVRNDTMSMQSE